MELTCPKCHGSMRTYERNGVHVDQCTDCRGIFLDRGELERLIDAENDWHSTNPADTSASSAPSSGQHQGQSAAAAGGLGAVVSEVLNATRSAKSHGSGVRYDQYGRPYGYGKPHHKKSFLQQLFD